MGLVAVHLCNLDRLDLILALTFSLSISSNFVTGFDVECYARLPAQDWLLDTHKLGLTI